MTTTFRPGSISKLFTYVAMMQLVEQGKLSLDANIQQYLDFRDQYHVPIWLGESGENKDEWIAAFTKTLEANHVGWCFWPYKKMDATSSVVTFDRPAHWDEILAFAKLAPGTGNAEKRIAARPSIEEAQQLLTHPHHRLRYSDSFSTL